MQTLERAAQAAGAQALVCTEKDVYNLSPAGFREIPAGYCRMGIQLSAPELFWREVLAAVARHRARAAREAAR